MALRKLILAAGALCAAVALGGCGADVFSSDTKFFSKSVDVFSTKDWGRAPTAAEISLTRKVTPDDYVDANGACATAAPAANDAAVGSVAGDLASASATPAAAAPPHIVGGIGLGMTECQVVQRAGTPGQINIGAEGTDRKVVMTYPAGTTWPGIYTFVAGRLTDIEAVAAPEPVKPVKKRATTKPKTAAR